MSDLVKSLIEAVDLEASEMANNDRGSGAASTALADLVSCWRTRVIEANDMINDFDAMLRQLINLRLRLAYAAETNSSQLGDYDDDENTTHKILDYVKYSWRIE